MKPNVAAVSRDRCDAGVHPDVVVLGNVVVVAGDFGTAALAEEAVPEAALIEAVVVVLLYYEVGGGDAVDPEGDFLHRQVFALAGDGVEQHRAGDVLAAEETYLLGYDGGYPVGLALLVDLKVHVGEHERRVVEAQVAVQVTEEIFAGRVAYALVYAGDLDLLRHHVDDEVGGDACALVVPPLEHVAVVEVGDAHGAVVVVYLIALGVDFELADEVAQFAETAGGQHVG